MAQRRIRCAECGRMICRACAEWDLLFLAHTCLTYEEFIQQGMYRTRTCTQSDYSHHRERTGELSMDPWAVYRVPAFRRRYEAALSREAAENHVANMESANCDYPVAGGRESAVVFVM